jgi:glutaredoxin
MKKFLLILMSIVSVFALSTFNVKATSLPTVTNHEKVTIYVFRGHGCSHCYGLLNYLYGNMSKYTDYINVVAYEVWNNTDNQTLMNAVASARNETVQGVPYIVVGSNYSKNGYGSTTDGDEIINKALEEYKNDSYKDIVASTLKTTKANVTAETLSEAASAEGISDSSSSSNNSSSTTNNTNTTTNNSSSNKYDTYIVVAIFAFIIGGVLLLVSSTNNRK